MPFFSVSLAGGTFNLIGWVRTLFAAAGPKCQSPPYTLEGRICPSSAGKQEADRRHSREILTRRLRWHAIAFRGGFRRSRVEGLSPSWFATLQATLTSISKRTNPPSFVTSESRARTRPLYVHRAEARDIAVHGVLKLSFHSCEFYSIYHSIDCHGYPKKG